MSTVYLETTIPSYLTARPSRDVVIAGKQEVTREWWEKRKNLFSLFISPYVIDEASRGDAIVSRERLEILQEFPVLAVDEEVTRLAELIIQGHAIPEKAATDASHVAIATRHGMDYLLTWNCTHIANAEIIRAIEQIMSKAGYVIPIICTPDELMGADEDA